MTPSTRHCPDKAVQQLIQNRSLIAISDTLFYQTGAHVVQDINRRRLGIRD